MTNNALSPLIGNLTMMTSQNWQINVIYLVENCLSYNISKFGFNWTNGFSDTKQNEIRPLTFICITKMASYQLDVFMWFDCLVTLHMHTKFGQFMMNGYEDMNDHVKTQNGAYMTSWLGDQAEKVIVSIPHQGKDTVKIWKWLLIPFLRYLKHKIHTERKKKICKDVITCYK